MLPVLLYGAVVAYQLGAGLAVQLQVLARVLRADQGLLLERDELGRVVLDPVDAHDLVTHQLAPQLMSLDALLAHVLAAVAAEGGGQVLLALLARARLYGPRLLEGVLDVEEVEDVEGGNEVSRPGNSEAGHTAARGAADVIGLAVRLDDQLEALLAEDMEAWEDPRVSVEVEADRARQLVFNLLKRLDDYLIGHVGVITIYGQQLYGLLSKFWFQNYVMG